MNYIIEYQNGEQITTKQLVKQNEFVRVKVRVEYKKDISVEELPTETDNLSLGFKINYVQSDGSGSSVNNSGIKPDITIVSGDGTQTGDEVCIGEECFYVMYSDDTSITMLAKYNLYVGNECSSTNSSGCTDYGAAATGKQDSNMLGWTVSGQPYKGVTNFSNTNYWYSSGLKAEYGTSYPAYVYDSNSILYSYVENYKSYLEGFGVTIEEARLIKSQELAELGCDFSKTTCSGAPSWVTLTTYWTGSANTLYSAGQLYVVYNSQRFYNNTYSFQLRMGLRPVIVISKDYFI